jgi:CheY-like chemotaxis protein
VVQGIVRSLDGAIDVASEAGKGTTFRVLLRCTERAAPDAREAAPSAARTPEPLPEATILIVEDEDLLRESVAKMLRKKGFSIIEAGDGSAAVEAIREHKNCVDVMLLDITLPGASSHTVLADARLLMPQTKVIATSAYSEDSAVASLQGQPDYFIRKPYRIADLVDLIRQALARV